MEEVIERNTQQLHTTDFAEQFVGCIVLSHNNQLVLQQRDEYAKKYPSALATFGGGIEKGETPLEALVRELKEELGAIVLPKEVINLGIITESSSNHRDLIYVYFWHDKNHTITGCFEGTACYYHSTSAALAHPNVMSDVRWLLERCHQQNLLPFA